MATVLKDKPIIFSGPMVRAILEDRKTQTRRVLARQPDSRYHSPGQVSGDWWGFQKPNQGTIPFVIKCPYQVGQRLWVRETWYYDEESQALIYRADPLEDRYNCEPWKWKPSIFMPRWASRLTLTVTSVRVERLQEITDEDALKEGMVGNETAYDQPLPTMCFQALWDTLHPKKDRWADNPWCWVVEFVKGVKI